MNEHRRLCAGIQESGQFFKMLARAGIVCWSVVQPCPITGASDSYIHQVLFLHQSIGITGGAVRQNSICDTDDQNMRPFPAFGCVNGAGNDMLLLVRSHRLYALAKFSKGCVLTGMCFPAIDFVRNVLVDGGSHATKQA